VSLVTSSALLFCSLYLNILMFHSKLLDCCNWRSVITDKWAHYEAPGLIALLEQLLSGFGMSVLLWDTNLRCHVHQSLHFIWSHVYSVYITLFCVETHIHFIIWILKRRNTFRKLNIVLRITLIEMYVYTCVQIWKHQ